MAPKTPTAHQDLCIKWNSYLGNLGAAFAKLLADQRFLDVTLSCEGQQLQCHKVVLAACSPYLETILNENPCKHPVIVLPRDIKMWELQALVDFMYKGEVNVSHAGLADFVKCAELLQVRGLSGSDEESSYISHTNGSSQQQTAERRPSVESTSSSVTQIADETMEKESGKKTIGSMQKKDLSSQPSSHQPSPFEPSNSRDDTQKDQFQDGPNITNDNAKLELIEEDVNVEGEKRAERIVEILCDIPNETHYTNVTQTSIFEHVEELDENVYDENGRMTYSDLDFDYIEQDSQRDSFNEFESAFSNKKGDAEKNYENFTLRRRPISEEKSDSDGATSGYSSLQILNVRSLANTDISSSFLKEPQNVNWQPDSENPEEDPNSGDVRVMLSSSLTRAIKRNVMNNRSYAIFRKTVRRRSTFGTRKKKNTNRNTTARANRCISPSCVVLQPPKQGQSREYDAKAMYAALMEVKAGDGITEASARHKIPRTTLCNWIKRLNIKSVSLRTRQKPTEAKNK